MVFENILSNLILAGIAGTIISGLAALDNGSGWVWRKYLFSLGIAVLSALVIIDGFGQQVTEANVIPIFVEIIGLSFLGNKLQGIGSKLKGSEE